jgi:hypothetical protein
MFNQSELPLLHTPRRFLIYPNTNLLVTIETDHNACSTAEKAQYEVAKDLGSDEPLGLDEERTFGEPKPGFSRWASCVRLIDPAESKTLDMVELTDNEAAVRYCSFVFFVVVNFLACALVCSMIKVEKSFLSLELLKIWYSNHWLVQKDSFICIALQKESLNFYTRLLLKEFLVPYVHSKEGYWWDVVEH